MTEGEPEPGTDDRIIVGEMLKDPQSEQWYECYLSVKRLIQAQAKNIPRDRWEDIAQDSMIRVHKYLPAFQFQCALSTWLFGIVRSCIIDNYRKSTRVGQHTAPAGDLHDDVEREGDAFATNATRIVNTTRTVEDEFITRDELDEALTALQEYVSIHANQTRNRRILDMVLLEGRSLEETAKAVGCSAPVVGYVVRAAQRYVRDRLGHQP